MFTSTDEIDALLEKYLHLLDEYTRARELLSKLQASVNPAPPLTRSETHI